MKKRIAREWCLWVHKELGFYCDPNSFPTTCGPDVNVSADFRWVRVREVVPKRRKAKNGVRGLHE